MDNQTEIEVSIFIFNYIEKNSITTIVISHKLNSFNEFNNVYKIEGDKVFGVKNDE